MSFVLLLLDFPVHGNVSLHTKPISIKIFTRLFIDYCTDCVLYLFPKHRGFVKLKACYCRPSEVPFSGRLCYTVFRLEYGYFSSSSSSFSSYYYYYYYYHRISHLSPLAGKYSPILGCSNQQD